MAFASASSQFLSSGPAGPSVRRSLIATLRSRSSSYRLAPAVLLERAPQRVGQHDLADRALRRLLDPAVHVVLDDHTADLEVDVRPLERAELADPQASVQREQDDELDVPSELFSDAQELVDLLVAVDGLRPGSLRPKFLDVGDNVDQPHALGDAEELRELAENEVTRADLEVVTEPRPKDGDPILVDHGERQRTEMRPEMVTEDCVVADASRRLLHPHMLRLEALVVEAFEGHLWDGFGYRLWCG
jgi:hypothetical protein